MSKKKKKKNEQPKEKEFKPRRKRNEMFWYYQNNILSPIRLLNLKMWVASNIYAEKHFFAKMDSMVIAKYSEKTGHAKQGSWFDKNLEAKEIYWNYKDAIKPHCLKIMELVVLDNKSCLEIAGHSRRKARNFMDILRGGLLDLAEFVDGRYAKKNKMEKKQLQAQN